MRVEERKLIYLLMNEGQGWISSEALTPGFDKQKTPVPRGSLVELSDGTREIVHQTSVQVKVLDQRNVRMVPLVSDLYPVGRRGDQTYQLLRGIPGEEKRYQEVKSGRIKDLARMRTGSRVIYQGPGEPEVPGLVRYLGQGPDGRSGWVLGLEILENSWQFGVTTGVEGGKTYFNVPCEKKFGLFCDMSQIKVCQNSCDTSRPGQLGSRPNLPGRSSVYAHPEKNQKYYASDAFGQQSSSTIQTGQSACNKRDNIESSRYNVQLYDSNSARNRVNNNNNNNSYDREESKFLKKFQNIQDAGSESDPAPPVRPGRRKPSESSDWGRSRTGGGEDSFSWDPNSKKKYEKDKYEERRGRRTPDSSRNQPRAIPELYKPAGEQRKSTGSDFKEERGLVSGRSFETSSSYEELNYDGRGDRMYDIGENRQNKTNSRQGRPRSGLDRPDSRHGRSDSRQGDLNNLITRTDSRQGGTSRLEGNSCTDYSVREGSRFGSRQDGFNRTNSRSLLLDNSEASLEFTDQQDSEDPWSSEVEFPLLVDLGRGGKEEPWSGEPTKPWRTKNNSCIENSLQDDTTRTWGEILSKPSPSGSQSSNQSEPREEAPRFDQLTEEGREGVHIAVGSMVQLEQTGQPVFGVVRWRGSVGDKRDWVGVELEDIVPGGGTGYLQGRSMFSCPEGKGVFVPVTHVRPDPRFSESGVGPSQEFGTLDCPPLPGVFSPHPAVAEVSKVAGRNRGIQGHQNSCYLDATLFSMFAFTSVFDSLLYRPKGPRDIPQYEEVQRVLRDEIVNPLRQRLFVRADRVMSLRTLLNNLSNVSGLMDQEKDPEEFLNSLLNQVMHANPYLELSSGQSSHTYQLFVEKDPELIVPSLQDLFDQSFLSSRVKLTCAPPILILQMPRFGRQFKMYDRVIPTQLLDITDVISGIPRQCVVCGQLATCECAQCYGDQEHGLQSTAFCDKCLIRLHQHAKRKHHVHTRLEAAPGWKQESRIPRINMELVAVVCIETSHYVSFVRCGDSIRSPWAFFDSMADRKGEQNGYNIPELTPAPEVDYILSEEGAKLLRENPNLPISPQAKRLISDAYICFYQSQEVQMYM